MGFLGLQLGYAPAITKKFYNGNIHSVLSIVPTWGIRKNSRGNEMAHFEIGLGVGYAHVFREGEDFDHVMVDLRCSFGLRPSPRQDKLISNARNYVNTTSVNNFTIGLDFLSFGFPAGLWLYGEQRITNNVALRLSLIHI